jgi:ribosomal protein L5
MPSGVKVELKGEPMYAFLETVIDFVLPRLKPARILNDADFLVDCVTWMPSPDPGPYGPGVLTWGELKGEPMYAFLETVIDFVLPRLKTFSGIPLPPASHPRQSLDARGHAGADLERRRLLGRLRDLDALARPGAVRTYVSPESVPRLESIVVESMYKHAVGAKSNLLPLIS